MSRRHSILFLLLTLTLIPACDNGGSSNSGRVAVVDLKQVSDRTGRTTQLQQSLVATQQQLQSRLQGLQEQIQNDINARTNALGPVPKPEDVQRLEAMKVAARQRFDQEVAASQEQINRVHVEFAARIKEDVRAVALAVAQKRGRSVVLMREAVIDYDPEADITDAVIQELLSTAGSTPSVSGPPSGLGGPSPAATAPASQPAPPSPFPPPPR